MHEDRKQWKKQARKVVKKHYVLLVFLCLIAIFYGTEYTFVSEQAESLYDRIRGVEPAVGGSELKLDTQKTRDKVFSDILEDNLKAGRDTAAQQMQDYKDGKDSGTVMGRQRGMLADLVNQVSSGHFYLTLFSGLHSMVHSTKAVQAILILLSILIAAVFWIFLKNMYQAILRRAVLEARTYDRVPISHLLHFKLVKRWWRASMTLLLTAVYLMLWTLTIVGLIIKTYSYRMVPFIVAENPDIKPREAILLSRRMMDGHKWECFKLDLSFIGWFALGTITFGITAILWSVPYNIATFSEYYTHLRGLAKENQIPGAERLNDEYLFARAEEKLLRETYSDIEEVKAYIDEHRITLPSVRAFVTKNFGLWLGSFSEKKTYDEVDKRRQQIAEERAVIKGTIYPQRLNERWEPKSIRFSWGVRFLKTYTVWSIVLVFFLFSLVGWVYEVSIHLTGDGTFVNRGTMHGPWLPIYGGGVAMIMILLARFRPKPLQEIIAIVVLCGVVEFSTSYFLELSKGMRWWDYTGYFLNLDGRICAEGLFVFAIGGAIGVYLVVPLLDALWSRINPKVLVTICVILLGCFFADMVYSHFVPNEGPGITDYDAYKESCVIRDGSV